jgi:predicted transcriptional regulator
MTVRISVPLDDEQRVRFEAIAEARQESLEAVVAEALVEYLDYDSAFRAAVEEGLAAERAGQVSDLKTFAEDLRRRMAERVAEVDV